MKKLLPLCTCQKCIWCGLVCNPHELQNHEIKCSLEKERKPTWYVEWLNNDNLHSRKNVFTDKLRNL